ncbi:hypothetical protein D3C78_666590 [compost metagenome]
MVCTLPRTACAPCACCSAARVARPIAACTCSTEACTDCCTRALSRSTSKPSLAWRPARLIAATASFAPCCKAPICAWMSPVELWVLLASALTSSATTAKPRPVSPARAASMAALSANRLVCSAIPWITDSTTSICSLCWARRSMTLEPVSTCPARSSMSLATWVEVRLFSSVAWRISTTCCKADCMAWLSA